MLNQQSSQIRNGDGKTNQKNIFGFPAHIKINAAAQQPNPLYFLRKQKIKNCNNGEENQKINGIELHVESLPFLRDSENKKIRLNNV